MSIFAYFGAHKKTRSNSSKKKIQHKQKMSAFVPEEWILVGDTDVCPHSKKQIQVCKDLQLHVKGAILCNEKANETNPACLYIPAFPAFCNTDKNVCVSGLRENKAAFDEMQKIVNTPPSK